MRVRLILVALLMLAGNAVAAEPERCGSAPVTGQVWQGDIRCNYDGRTLEMSACAALDRDYEDCLLRGVVDRLIAKATASEGPVSRANMFGPNYVDSVREAHVAWLDWRARECALATIFEMGG